MRETKSPPQERKALLTLAAVLLRRAQAEKKPDAGTSGSDGDSETSKGESHHS